MDAQPVSLLGSPVHSCVPCVVFELEDTRIKKIFFREETVLIVPLVPWPTRYDFKLIFWTLLKE
jgi:hypothetical protein